MLTLDLKGHYYGHNSLTILSLHCLDICSFGIYLYLTNALFLAD
jgi:hypothetical protein